MQVSPFFFARVARVFISYRCISDTPLTPVSRAFSCGLCCNCQNKDDVFPPEAPTGLPSLGSGNTHQRYARCDVIDSKSLRRACKQYECRDAVRMPYSSLHCNSGTCPTPAPRIASCGRCCNKNGSFFRLCFPLEISKVLTASAPNMRTRCSRLVTTSRLPALSGLS